MIAAAPAGPVAPVVARRQSRIRAFVEADIPEVARVHRAAFRIIGETAPDSYRDYFRSVFLGTHARNSVLPSLVHEESDGRITGFVGVVPRRMVIGGRRYDAVVSSQFIVDPQSQVGLVAMRLAKGYLEGPQDLSIADEANEVSRKIFEGLGGAAASLLSLYWTRPLRPARLGLSMVQQRRRLAPFAVAARPVASLADAVVASVPGSPLRLCEPCVDHGDLSAPELLRHARAASDAGSLRVEHDDHAFQWLLDRARRHGAGARLLTGVVKNGSTIRGWYIACIDRDGVADVAQLGADPASIHDVLDHLFYRAWQAGAISATGRMDARFMQALSDKHCVFHRRGPWVLIKSHHARLLHALQTGATSFSRFDGEWSLRYQP